MDSLLATEGDKHNAPELIVLVILPIVLAFFLYRFAKSRVERGAPRWQLCAALVPLLLGVFFAFAAYTDISDDNYRDFHFITPRSVILHYAAFFVPLAATVLVIGLIVYGAYRDRMER